VTGLNTGMNTDRAADSSDRDSSIVGRAFVILGAFRVAPVLGVSELARMTGIPRSSVHRLAHQLLDEGALTRVGTKFRVGATLFELGQLHFPQRLRETLQPILDDLQRTTGHDVALCELIDCEIVVVAASRMRRSKSTIGFVGQRLPAHAVSGGMVLLEVEDRVPAKPIVSLTSATLTDRAKILQRFATIRTNRFAVEHGEVEIGRSSVAVQVLNRHRRVLGALMVSGPTELLDIEATTATLANFSPTLTAVGRQASIGFFASARPKSIQPTTSFEKESHG
jgi:IclR family transcriptional regulator, acetate operon repressor